MLEESILRNVCCTILQLQAKYLKKKRKEEEQVGFWKVVHLGVGGLLSDEAKESVMMDKSLPMAMCTLVQHWAV